jgi:2-deoxy-D-gluconate 3-dehydrogenase
MPSSQFSLAGKVAIVTGGNGGIGYGMAEGLAAEGAKIVIGARNAEKSKAAAARLSASHGVETAVASVDVADPASARALIASTVERFGRLDILINNAGINIRKLPQEFTPEDWRQVTSINLDGAFFCSQAAYPALLKAGGGKIINIGSMYSLFGSTHVTAYAASKGGIVQMTKALAASWAKDNIQVNAVLPGWITTELTDRAKKDLPGLNERVLARTPTARWGEPADFRGIAAFLASPASNFVTGTAIAVDGGYSIAG